MTFVFTAQECGTIKDILKTEDVTSALKKVLSTSLWTTNTQLSESLRGPLLRACAWYLYKEKRRSYALNSVGMFCAVFFCNYIYNTSIVNYMNYVNTLKDFLVVKK